MNDRPPAFTVVMPLYNKEREVARAVQSVLAQTVTDFELVIVDDGSTDGSAIEMSRFTDPRIRLLSQSNAGVSAARNAGIRAARSGWVAFLDADDEWRPDFLETIRRLREKFPSCTLLATRYWVGGADGRLRPAVVRGLPFGRDEAWEGIIPDYFAIAARSEPPVCSSAVCVRKSSLEAAGLFPEGVIAGEDLLTWAKVAVSGSVAYSNTPHAVFWTPASLDVREARAPQVPDRVGECLVALQSKCLTGRIRSLRRYIAHWHKMRAVIFLRRGEYHATRAEIRTASGYNFFNHRILALRLLFSLPGNCIPPILRVLDRGQRNRKHTVQTDRAEA